MRVAILFTLIQESKFFADFSSIPLFRNFDISYKKVIPQLIASTNRPILASEHLPILANLLPAQNHRFQCYQSGIFSESSAK